MVSCLRGRTRNAIAIAILGAAFSSATAAAPGTGLPGTVQLAKSPPMLASATATTSIAANETLRKASLPGASLRARLLSVDLSVLERAKTSILADALPQIIRVPFFDDAVLDIEILRTEPTSSGGTAYVGRLIGDPHSIAVLVNNNGTVSFNVAGLGQRHELHGSAEAGFVAKQKTMVDRPDHPPGSTGIVERVLQEVRDIAPQKNVIGAASALASLKTPPLAVQTLADSGATIDIMVVYTPAARLSQTPGTTAQMNANIDAQIVTTNTIYANSNATQRLRLVYKGEVNYTEVNMDVDLPRLENTSDGFLDDVPILRNLYAADLVSLWGVYSDYCGLGSLMSTESASFESVGYNVVASPNCTGAGGYTFAHELGHNMGSQHNPENGSGPTFPYGFGHYVNGSYRTVMSYVDPCPSGCTRVAYFSNPNVIFNNAPTGINNARDNARSINNTADTIAAYRYSGSSIMMSSYNGGEALPRLVSRNLTWSSDNITGNVRIDVSRDESTNWQTLVASTPNEGTEPVTVGGRATRRARVRVVSLNSPAVSDSSVGNISIR